MIFYFSGVSVCQDHFFSIFVFHIFLSVSRSTIFQIFQIFIFCFSGLSVCQDQFYSILFFIYLSVSQSVSQPFTNFSFSIFLVWQSGRINFTQFLFFIVLSVSQSVSQSTIFQNFIFCFSGLSVCQDQFYSIFILHFSICQSVNHFQIFHLWFFWSVSLSGSILLNFRSSFFCLSVSQSTIFKIMN